MKKGDKTYVLAEKDNTFLIAEITYRESKGIIRILSENECDMNYNEIMEALKNRC